MHYTWILILISFKFISIFYKSCGIFAIFKLTLSVYAFSWCVLKCKYLDSSHFLLEHPAGFHCHKCPTFTNIWSYHPWVLKRMGTGSENKVIIHSAWSLVRSFWFFNLENIQHWARHIKLNLRIGEPMQIRRLPAHDFLQGGFTLQTSRTNNKQVISTFKFVYPRMTLKEGSKVKSDHIKRLPAHDFL